VSHKIVYPAFQYFGGKVLDKFPEIRQLGRKQRPPASNRTVPYSRHSPVFDFEFRAALPTTALAVNVYGLVFVGIKEYDNPKILI
jgi:hypothetical protein